jgi:uncharacterized protein (TIGR03437 family)
MGLVLRIKMLRRLFILIAASAAGVVHGASITYDYDTLNRLTRVAYPDGTTISYTYDPAGNRLSQVISNPSIPLPKVAVDKNTLAFSAAVGQTSGSKVIAVTNAGGGSLQWDAVSGASWLSVTPASGTNSGAVSVTASAAGMSAGTYNGSVTILASASNPSVTIPVIFAVTPAPGNPSITSGGIVSAAGSVPGIARGSVASLYGSALADASTSAATVPLPTTLGNVQVSVIGVNAPLWYTGPGQINFQIPFESPLQGQASFVVTRDGVASAPMNVALSPYAPSIFTYQRAPGVFDPIIVHAANSLLVTPTSPAIADEYIVVYGTGIGDLTVVPATDTLSPTTPLASAKLTPTATIGGVKAPVSFAGLTPGGIGLAQFNVQVPSSLPQGDVLPLVIQFGSVSSIPVNLAMKAAGAGKYLITTVAGDGGVGFDDGGGVAIVAHMDAPRGMSLDSHENLYVADTSNSRVREVTPDGRIATIAGTGGAGFSGDGVAATVTSLSQPYSVAVDTTDNVYIADTYNDRIRRITSDGIIATVAGTGLAGFAGDGGPAQNASVNKPYDVGFDRAGNMYLADHSNGKIRKISSTGTITTLPTVGSFNNIEGISVDASGNLYVADSGWNMIFRFSPSGGQATIVAGTGGRGFSGDGGKATVATMSGPEGVAVDADGNTFIADTLNNRIRMVTPDGSIKTIAGVGTAGFGGDNGPAEAAQLNTPSRVLVGPDGTIYVSDKGNNRIRKLTPR